MQSQPVHIYVYVYIECENRSQRVSSRLFGPFRRPCGAHDGRQTAAVGDDHQVVVHSDPGRLMQPAEAGDGGSPKLIFDEEI